MRPPARFHARPRRFTALFALLLAFAALPARADPTLSAVPAASDIGFDRYILGRARAEVPTGGLRCGPSVQAPEREVCAGSWLTNSPDKIYLLGTWLSEFQLVFAQDQLVRIEAVFDSRSFDRVRLSLQSRYGSSEDSREVISGGYGIRIAGQKLSWRLPNAMIVAREAAGVLHYSSVKFYNGAPPMTVRPAP